MVRPVGSKDSYKRKVTPERKRLSQTVALKDGKHSTKFNNYLEKVGFKDKELTIEKIKELAPNIVEDLELIQRAETTRGMLLEMYKQLGDIGVSTLNQLREVDMSLMRIKQNYVGREEEYLLDTNYIKLLDLRRKLTADLNKLNLDKTKFVAEQVEKGNVELFDDEAFYDIGET